MESWVTHDSSTLEPDPREEFWVARDSFRAGAPDSVGTKEDSRGWGPKKVRWDGLVVLRWARGIIYVLLRML